ncbi:MAG TPA: VOC family protein [Burkholderiaceae bacterium]|nr:VOC family protein [Burkholderiaceae bacterium]
MATAFETHGAFSWTELLTNDVAAARKFYGQLLGWKIRDMEGSPMDYRIISADDQDIGGMMTIPEHAKGMAPAWGTYVTVKDVDETTGRVKALGGRILLAPQDIPGVGRFSVIQDPQGATLSLITYNRER